MTLRPHRRHRSLRGIVSGPRRHGRGLPANARHPHRRCGSLSSRRRGYLHYAGSLPHRWLLNGWLVARAGVAPFIATLGTLYIARGAALLISNGKTFPNLAGQSLRGNKGFPLLGQSSFLGIPSPVWIMLCLFALAWLVAVKTPLGRHIYAVGGNERAARLAGDSRAPCEGLYLRSFFGMCSARGPDHSFPTGSGSSCNRRKL